MKDDVDVFQGHDSLCKDRQRLIVSSEKRSKHIAENDRGALVRQYKIDGDVITGKDTDKCDYAVLNDDRKAAYLIELKGSDLLHAMEQLEKTRALLMPSLKEYQFYYRIVFSGSATHSVNMSEYYSWQKKCGQVNGCFVAQMKRVRMREKI